MAIFNSFLLVITRGYVLLPAKPSKSFVKAHRFEDEGGLWVHLGPRVLLVRIHGVWEDGHRLPCLGVDGNGSSMDVDSSRKIRRKVPEIAMLNNQRVYLHISMGDLQDPTDWRYVSTIFLAIFSGDIPWNLGLKNRPYIWYSTSNLESWNGHWFNGSWFLQKKHATCLKFWLIHIIIYIYIYIYKYIYIAKIKNHWLRFYIVTKNHLDTHYFIYIIYMPSYIYMYIYMG